MPRPAALTASALFLGLIVAANWITTTHGLIAVAFGLSATAGTYLAGLTFIARDAVQDSGGRWLVVLVILAGAVLSLIIALLLTDSAGLPPGVTGPRIAAASAAAFLLSEAADFAVYSPLRRRGYLRAAVASNVVGSVVDTFIFLALSGFGLAAGVFAGQVVGKVTMTALLIPLVVGGRAVLNARQATA